MYTKHVTSQIERYLDRQLSAGQQQVFENHLAVCPTCARRLFESQQLRNEIGPVIRTALGQPTPPPALRHRIRQDLMKAAQTSPGQSGWMARFREGGLFRGMVRFRRVVRLSWTMPGRILNTAGTLAAIFLLALAVFAVIQSQLPGADVLTNPAPLRPGEGGSQETSTATPAPISTSPPQATATPLPKLSSLGDTLAGPTPPPATSTREKISASPSSDSPSLLPKNREIELEDRLRQESAEADEFKRPIAWSKLPGSVIAFSFFNPAAHRQVYEVHLINPDGLNHRLFPLDGVSEAALRRTNNGYQLAYRAWSEPTTPRSLLISNLKGYRPRQISSFWEDAQPDWSPTENRLIFASQRESDRRWRLYTNWGDGSAEKNLRREGKSPTFAPDGYRFAFESCDQTGNRCGLWLADLEHSEYGAKPFLEDERAKSPDWSPVGEQIAFMANPGGNWDLYLAHSDGSNVRRLTTNPAIDGLPTWSPDGQWLAFLSNRGENWGVWLLHVASGQTRQIFNFDGGIFTPPNRPPYGERHWWDEQLSWSR